MQFRTAENSAGTESDFDFDVVIVGGGMAGLGLAYGLVTADEHVRVAVIDDRRVAGTGGTRGAVGMLRQSFPEAANRVLARGTFDLVHWAVGQPHLPVKVSFPGSIILSAEDPYGGEHRGPGDNPPGGGNPADDAPLEKMAAGTLDRWPGLKMPDDVTGWLCREDGIIDPFDLMDLFWFGLHGTKRARFFPEQAVTGFRRSGGTIVEIVTTAGRFDVSRGHAVIAAGLDTPALTAMLDYEPPVDTVRHGAVVVRMHGGVHFEPGMYPAVIDSRNDIFLSVSGPYATFGGRAPEPMADEKGEWNWDALAGLVEQAQQLCPALEDARVERVWSPVDLTTPDGVPLAGPIPELGNGWIFTGFGGRGTSLAPGAAALLGRRMTGHHGDAAVLAAMDPGRF